METLFTLIGGILLGYMITFESKLEKEERIYALFELFPDKIFLVNEIHRVTNISFGSLYVILERLTREGKLQSVGAVKDGKKRLCYRLNSYL